MVFTIDSRLRGATVPLVVLQQPGPGFPGGLSPESRLLIGILVMMGGEVSFPSVERQAELMGCSRSSAKRARLQLEQAGWLQIEKRYGTAGRQLANRYRLGIPSRLDQPASGGGVQDEPDPPGQDAPPPGSRWPTKYSVENNSSEKNGSTTSGTGDPPGPRSEQRRQRQYPPEVHAEALKLTVEIRGDIESVYRRKPEQATFGRDLSLLCRMVQHSGADDVRAMAREFFRWREARGVLISVPELYRVRERLLHEVIKANEGRTR